MRVLRTTYNFSALSSCNVCILCAISLHLLRYSVLLFGSGSMKLYYEVLVQAQHKYHLCPVLVGSNYGGFACYCLYVYRYDYILLLKESSASENLIW